MGIDKEDMQAVRQLMVSGTHHDLCMRLLKLVYEQDKGGKQAYENRNNR